MSAPDRLSLSYYAALSDFRRARRRAALQELLTRLTRHSDDLLAYSEIASAAPAGSMRTRRLEVIPLNAIVGSVGRYADFNRRFLPRRATDEQRWARVKVAMTEGGGLPPIEVYKLGDVYFVLDGNHRVSVAREVGATEIEAYVTEVLTPVELSPADDPAEAIIKARHAAFMETCKLDKIRPDNTIRVTAPGQYRVLEEHIRAHRNTLAAEGSGEKPTMEAAVASWYDNVYSEAVQLIRARGLLREFPERTETDLYVWLTNHREYLEEELGWNIRASEAVSDLPAANRGRWRDLLARLARRLRPPVLRAGPQVGEWRQRSIEANQAERLFREILAPIHEGRAGWLALEQAHVIARLDRSHVRGLHVRVDDGKTAESIAVKFERLNKQAGVQAELAIDAGTVTASICDRAQWVDLVIVAMERPPGGGPFARLSNGLTSIIRSAPRPILFVPEQTSQLRRPLLAFDGSPKAFEALYISAYIAACWSRALTVVSVGRRAGTMLRRARSYLDSRGVEAHFVRETGAAPAAILGTAQSRKCDVILMGGYGLQPVMEVVLGSTVDHVLRESDMPVLICR